MKFKYIFIFIVGFICQNYCYSQSLYQKDKLTILADSLHNDGQYKQALLVREQAISTQYKASKEYQIYLKAKYFQTKSADFEFDSYNYHNPDKGITKKHREELLNKALASAIKARDLYIKVKNPDKIFQYQIQSRIYHQTAYLGNWKHSLEQAQLGYDFLNDTISIDDRRFVDLIYDIGYIYSKLGDYSKSIDGYQSSLDLYQKILGKNNNDVALTYNNIAVEYKNLGLRKKELESLLEAKNIWENLNEDSSQGYLYRCYGNLFHWYSYYGDFDKAEEYILKKDKLRTIARTTKNNEILRNKEEIYEDKLSEWFDLMWHYARKKDTIKTLFYADNILKIINPDKKLLSFEAKKLSTTLKLYASFIEKNNSDEALNMLDKAIDLQEKYREIYFTKPFDFQMYKVELLLNAEKYAEAKILLEYLNGLHKGEEISNRFKLAILNANTAHALHDNKTAKTYFDSALTLLNNSQKNIETLISSDLKPMISFEVIEGFLDMGDFYFQLYKQGKAKENLQKATHRYLLASKVYNQLYLGQQYNDNLFTVNNAINKSLIAVGIEQSNDKKLLSEILNTIENNASKLTWSKFVFNNKRQNFKVSEKLINAEENSKAQLNFYQNSLVNAKDSSEEKVKILKDIIYELTNKLSKIQDTIKEQSNAYYQSNVQIFDIVSFQKALKKEEVLMKYIFAENYLYVFLISENSIKLIPLASKTTVLEKLKIALKSLKQRSSNYAASLKNLETLLIPPTQIQNYKKLTIIPDGALHYLPFETLFLNQKIPLISYNASLLLYQEQKALKPNFETINIGAFSASNNNSKLLNVSDEVRQILKIFNGKPFYNGKKSEFLKSDNQFNILHLAMHSKIDEANPKFSSLNFYGEKDNELFISELYNETFKANMAVLSACNTGNGFFKNGEGVISLSRAFNYAGIPSTVMSLWKVDDEATAKIMTYFYEHLKLGETKDEALKNAKLKYLKNTDDELLKHPYYWSGFVITGNTDALVVKQNFWFYLLILPFIGLVIFRKRLFQFFKQ